MSQEAPALVRQAASTRAASVATALDIALTDYQRRYGNVRFCVTAMTVTESGGVEFTVATRG